MLEAQLCLYLLPGASFLFYSKDEEETSAWGRVLGLRGMLLLPDPDRENLKKHLGPWGGLGPRLRASAEARVRGSSPLRTLRCKAHCS